MNECIIIDGNSLANRAYYGVPPLSNKQGVVTNAVYGFLNMIGNLLREREPAYVVVAFDVGKTVFRHESYADYKANRKPMPDDLRSQMDLIREALTLMRIKTIGIEGYEGDDVIGTVARQMVARGVPATIVSGDRDTFQLIDAQTTVLYPRRGLSDVDLVDLQAMEAQYGLTPTQIIDLKGLMGDSSDNIPGVPGVGEKTAKKLLVDYGSIEALYQHLDDFTGKKLGEKLAENREIAFLSKSLATIRLDVPLEIEPDECAYVAPDVPALRAFYQKLGLATLEQQLNALHGEVEDVFATPVEGDVYRDLEAIERFFSALEPGFCSMVVYFDGAQKNPIFLDVRMNGKNSRILCEGRWSDICKSLYAFIEHSQTQIITDDAKKLCRAFYMADADASAIVWDAALSHYLLHPENREHDIPHVFFEQLSLTLPAEEPARGFAMLEGLEQLHPLISDQLKEAEIWDLYMTVELPLAAILADMELDGVKVNVAYLESLEQEFAERIETIQEGIYVSAGETFNLNSPKQLGQILFEKLGLPVIKKTKTGYSTNAEVLDALRSEHGIIEDILEYRQIAKLKSTYVDGLLGLADASGKVHTTFNQSLTATGRLSSSEPNLQNIPVRTEEGRRIRQAFIPSQQGQVLVAADYSQIELRVLAHMSRDKSLMDSFLHEEDIHRRTASEVFHTPIEQVSSAQRRAAKAVNFGIIYGQTDFGLARELGIGRKEAQTYIDLYFERYPQVRAYLDQTIAAAREDGYVTTLLGRRRTIADIHSKNHNLRAFAERTAVNTPIQGSAADIIKLAMIDCDRRLQEDGFHSKMILQVHDELIFEAPPEEVAQLIKTMRAAMENVVVLNVPLEVDVKVGFNWQEMERI